MPKTGILHLVDTLDAGGAELMAVNLVNHLPRGRYRPYLCATRRGGSLLPRLHPDVGYLDLGRRGRFDLSALRRLIRFVQERNIRILHAHGTALFVARVVTLRLPDRKLVWHAHSGTFASEDRKSLPWRLASRGAMVVTASEDLAGWVRRRLGVPASLVHYLRNFVVPPELQTQLPSLVGKAGFRIACVANLRPPKDHITLIRALAKVAPKFPDVHLFIVGATLDQRYAKLVEEAVEQSALAGHVSFLGSRNDIVSVVMACDIGVISSRAEGLPMALLEYGLAGCATIATRVGECAKVLDDGRVGILVNPGSPEALADAIEDLLASPEKRTLLGGDFRRHVEKCYNASAVVDELCQRYAGWLACRPEAAEEPVPASSAALTGSIEEK